ncbi:MAG: DUF3309 family protein [Elusimicrobia bacterium]|nr:DUF3309 family protein [Elusimicrobiota bacterium]
MCGRYSNQWIVGFLLVYLTVFLPLWPYSRLWDYTSSGRIAVVLGVF